jgi:hypothetical protein
MQDPAKDQEGGAVVIWQCLSMTSEFWFLIDTQMPISPFSSLDGNSFLLSSIKVPASSIVVRDHWSRRLGRAGQAFSAFH